MICGYEFVDGAVCMQGDGHGPIGAVRTVPHIHPDDVMTGGRMVGSYFELLHILQIMEDYIHDRWVTELNTRKKD